MAHVLPGDLPDRDSDPSRATNYFNAPKSANEAVRPAPARRQLAGAGHPHKISSEYQLVSFSDTDYEKSVVKSAHRALQVFEFFAEYRAPATASDIAINLDFPQSSTSMLLRSLVSLGYLRYCERSRLYSPSLRMSLMAGWQPEMAEIAAETLDLMQRLNEATGECVTLAEQHRHHVRYIYVMQSKGPEKVHYVPHGTLRPIGSTACGQMLLTLKPERDVRAIIHRARSEPDSMDYGMGIEEVAIAVEKCRALGYAYTSRIVEDFRSYQLATLLPVKGDVPPMAIGITSHGDKFVERQPEILATMLDLVGKMREIQA